MPRITPVAEVPPRKYGPAAGRRAGRPVSKWTHELIVALLSRPGEWQRIAPEPGVSKRAVYARAQRIRSGDGPWGQDDGRFEAQARDTVLYARYVPHGFEAAQEAA